MVGSYSVITNDDDGEIDTFSKDDDCTRIENVTTRFFNTH